MHVRREKLKIKTQVPYGPINAIGRTKTCGAWAIVKTPALEWLYRWVIWPKTISSVSSLEYTFNYYHFTCKRRRIPTFLCEVRGEREAKQTSGFGMWREEQARQNEKPKTRNRRTFFFFWFLNLGKKALLSCGGSSCVSLLRGQTKLRRFRLIRASFPLFKCRESEIQLGVECHLGKTMQNTLKLKLIPMYVFLRCKKLIFVSIAILHVRHYYNLPMQ